MMSQEDLNSQITRYLSLVDHWSTHRCPTFLDFKPLVD